MHQVILKILTILTLIIALSGCNDNDAWCEGNSADAYDNIDQIKQVKQTTLKINSVSAEIQDDNYTKQEIKDNYGKWVNSGFTVKKGDTYEISANGQIVIADDYYDNTADGLGKKYVISANKKDPTLIPDFEFVVSQQVTVTTKDCAIGESSYCTPPGDSSSNTNCEPTKWTWNTAWQRDEVKCDYINVDEFYFEDQGNRCLAYRCCNKGAFGECWNYDNWYCEHRAVWQEKAYLENDICPAPTGTYATKTPEAFICDGNQGKDACYGETKPTYLNKNGYCDGKDGNKTGSAPSCGTFGISNQAKTPYAYNKCGYLDSCWATGGYGLYAIEEGTFCPNGGCDDDNPNASSACTKGCTHLNGSYETFDENHGDTSIDANGFSSGTSFAYTGAYSGGSGYLYLSIINPRDTSKPEDDLSQNLQDENEQLNQDINALEAEINDLRTLLNPQLESINGYSKNMDNLESDAVNLNSGIVGSPEIPENQAVKDQLSEIETLFDLPETQVTDSTTGVTATIYGIQKTFDYFNDDIKRYLEGYTYTDDNGTSETSDDVTETVSAYSDTYWVSTAKTMKNQSLEIIEAGNNLTTTLVCSKSSTATVNSKDYMSTSGTGRVYCTTTPEDLEAYKKNINNIMGGASDADGYNLNSAIDYAIKLQEGACPTIPDSSSSTCVETKETEGIDDKEAQIDEKQAQIDENNQEILEATLYGNDDLMGGYTVYVKAGGLVGDHGQYLCAVISDYDPNLPENEKYVTELFCNGNTKMTYSTPFPIQASGTIWLKIDDPDGRYDNNSQYYNLVMGKVTYTSGFSSMLTSLINLIKNTVTTTAERVFKGLTCSDGDDKKTSVCIEYVKIITAMLYLYVIIFGMMYIFGLIQHDQVDFILRIVKIAAVIILIQPGSFEFFNTYLFQGFFGFSNTLIAYATGAPVSNPFDFITLNMNVLILDETTYYKIIGLIFQGLLGIVAFALLVYGMVSFVCAFFSAFLVYMVSFVGLGMCFAAAPIFIVFLLFNKTSYLFDNWFKLTVKYTVQPVILLVGLIIINGMLTGIIESIFNYYVCFKCTVPFTFALPGFDQVGTTTLFCVSWFSPWGGDNVDSPLSKALMSLPLAISFCMVTSAMKIYADKLAGDIASQIVGSDSSMTKSTGISMGINPLKDFDHSAFRLAKATGMAKDEKEYKALRNKTLKVGFKASLALSALSSPMATAGFASRTIRNSRKNKLDPESLQRNDNPGRVERATRETSKALGEGFNTVINKVTPKNKFFISEGVSKAAIATAQAVKTLGKNINTKINKVLSKKD